MASVLTEVQVLAPDIIRLAHEVVKTVVGKSYADGKRGCVFCLADYNGDPVALAIIGDVPDPEKRAKYWRLALEKAQRLGSSKDLASWDSREPENGKWGGAVRGRYIFSISGFPELVDEMAASWIGYQSISMTRDLVIQIAARRTEAGNDYMASELGIVTEVQRRLAHR